MPFSRLASRRLSRAGFWQTYLYMTIYGTAPSVFVDDTVLMLLIYDIEPGVWRIFKKIQLRLVVNLGSGTTLRRVEQLKFFFCDDGKRQGFTLLSTWLVDEPCWQEGFFPREEKRQRGSRWSERAGFFSFVVEVFKMAPVFPASLVLISRLSIGFDRLVDATLRHIKWCRTSTIPARAAELNVAKSNSRSMLSIISD
jgi:hypothetical protein